MTWNEVTAELFLESEIEWNSEPLLSNDQKQFLTSVAQATSTPTYTINSLGAAIYLGLSWKLSKAVEYHEGDEEVIFEHLKQQLAKWAIYADPELGGTPVDSLQLVELEVGRNFDVVEV
jgi:hypothetical protein